MGRQCSHQQDLLSQNPELTSPCPPPPPKACPLVSQLVPNPQIRAPTPTRYPRGVGECQEGEGWGGGPPNCLGGRPKGTGPVLLKNRCVPSLATPAGLRAIVLSE